MRPMHMIFAKLPFVAAVLVVIFSSNFAHADQMMWMTEEKAKTAVGLLNGQAFVRYFCAPCGDERSEMIVIESIESAYTGSRDFWEVAINGEARDLAYTYFRQEGKWVNVAYKLNFVPYESPIYLEEF